MDYMLLSGFAIIGAVTSSAAAAFYFSRPNRRSSDVTLHARRNAA